MYYILALKQYCYILCCQTVSINLIFVQSNTNYQKNYFTINSYIILIGSCKRSSACFNQGCVYGLLMTVQCHWLYSCIYREKLRKNFSLPDEPCCDCCVHFCCESCALCQEHAELKARGFDPSNGTYGSTLIDTIIIMFIHQFC